MVFDWFWLDLACFDLCPMPGLGQGSWPGLGLGQDFGRHVQPLLADGRPWPAIADHGWPRAGHG